MTIMSELIEKLDVSIRHDPRSKDDPKPYIAAIIVSKDDGHFGHGATPSEALLLAASHWHARAIWPK